MERDLKDAFAGALCHRFIDTWLAWRVKSAATLPRRSEIEARDLAPVMGNCTVIDVPPEPDAVTIRLAGVQVCERWGFELSGRQYIACLGSRNPREQTQQVIDAAHHPCGMRKLRHVYRKNSTAASLVELCFLPVHDDRCDTPQLFVMGAAGNVPDTVTPSSDPVVRCADVEVSFLDIGAGVPTTSVFAYR